METSFNPLFFFGVFQSINMDIPTAHWLGDETTEGSAPTE
jgi:hypothetical protein